MKVGDYVRTKHFGINKIKGFYSDDHYDYIMVDDDLIKKEDIIKSSPNIIDLIEVGDYVNEKEVLELKNFGSFNGIRVFGDIYYNEDIKSIVTKEQFEDIKYEVN